MDLCDIREVRALLGRHGFRFSKAMGQNFLVADWAPRDIAAASGADAAHGVLEVGPGVGCLTWELCQKAAAVVSVELDRSLLPVLAETMADADNFRLISADILKLDIPAVLEQNFPGLTPLVCANLPYNITTPALRVLVEAGRFEAITVMVQKEVAQRIAAPAGSGDYGAFSVYMQYHTRPEVLFDVPASCFLPAPKVTSAVVHCPAQGLQYRIRRAEIHIRNPEGEYVLRQAVLHRKVIFQAVCILPVNHRIKVICRHNAYLLLLFVDPLYNRAFVRNVKREVPASARMQPL